MKNYVYIISSLPVLSRTGTDAVLGEEQTSELMEEIRSQCSEDDNALIDIVIDGFDKEKINREFYLKAAQCDCKFVRDYFEFDRNVRNRKAMFLNGSFGRPSDQDCIRLSEDEEESFEQTERLEGILHGSDILERERALDGLVWEQVDCLTTFSYFSFDCILAFIVKLNIVERWFKLDPQTGREMFRKLADEVMGTFKGLDCKA